MERLQDGLRFLERSIVSSSPAFSVNDGLKHLATMIEERGLASRSAPADVSMPDPVLQERLVSELSIYVGQRTAVELLQRCGGPRLSRDRFRPVIEPVLTAFLGRYTGSAVLANVLRIWDCNQHVAG